MTVTNGSVQIATTDLGGEGPGLVLMHGLGDSRRTMAKVAARLSGWRVISMDLRGHGASTSGTWTFDTAVSDLDAVVEHYALEKPCVAGHSLGGMVALQYALAGRPVSSVVNIDGWGPGIAERYLGKDPALVTERLDTIASGELPSRLARLLVARSRQSREGTTQQVLRLLHGADVVAWHRDAPCPSLAFNAVAPASGVLSKIMGPEMARLQAAHRRGLSRDLAALSHEVPAVTVVEIDARHDLIRTRPDDVAQAIQALR